MWNLPFIWYLTLELYRFRVSAAANKNIFLRISYCDLFFQWSFRFRTKVSNFVKKSTIFMFRTLIRSNISLTFLFLMAFPSFDCKLISRWSVRFLVCLCFSLPFPRKQKSVDKRLRLFSHSICQINFWFWAAFSRLQTLRQPKGGEASKAIGNISWKQKGVTVKRDVTQNVLAENRKMGTRYRIRNDVKKNSSFGRYTFFFK